LSATIFPSTLQQMKSRILVVEDEPSILDNVLFALETDGFAPHGVSTAGSALAAIAREAFALIVVDVGLPDISGFDLCKEIRRSSDVPMIFLTARGGEVDRVVGLEIGGDDYVVKPFSPRELSARVKAVLRRIHPAPGANAPAGQAITSGGFQVDSDQARIYFHGQVLNLSATEYRLLRTLCERPGRVLSRQQLMEAAWEDPGAALERTVDVHIKALRGKLREVDPESDPIQTHRGFGYSLVHAA
jgi:two-component system catabolic regulation response regulator CreB